MIIFLLWDYTIPMNVIVSRYYCFCLLGQLRVQRGDKIKHLSRRPPRALQLTWLFCGDVECREEGACARCVESADR